MALTKPQKIQKLKDLGVQLSGDESVKDLDALLSKYDEASVNAQEPIGELEDASEVKTATQVDNGTKTRVSVTYINPEFGLTSREFTLVDHGENFIAIAKGFCDKFNGTLESD